MTLKVLIARSIAASRPLGGLPSMTPKALRLGGAARRLPVLDMIETIERTRSGCSIAVVWAIIPPIEAPTRWAESMSRWSIRPTVSAAMSRSR